MDLSVFDNFPKLTTERLYLNRHELSDALPMFELRSDPEVMRFMDANPASNVSQIESKISEIRNDFDNKKGINWTIRLKDESKVIGYMSLWRIDFKNHRGEIGYAIKKEYWKRGISIEAAIAVINFGFDKLKLNTIMANTNIDNTPSHSLLEKLNFSKEAYHREDFFFNGKYLDSMIFGLTKSDWINRKSDI